MIEKILQRFSYVRKIEEGNKVLNARIGSLLAVEEVGDNTKWERKILLP